MTPSGIEAHKIRRFSLVATLLFFVPLTAVSKDLLSCVDPDVVAAFLERGRLSGREISDELPQDFAAIPFPRDYLFIGSSVSETASSIAFRTDREPADAVFVVREILGEQGWNLLAQRARPRVGFQENKATMIQHVPLCHTDGQSMSISSRREDRGTYVVLSKTFQCSELQL
jgi:hypothetical protein